MAPLIVFRSDEDDFSGASQQRDDEYTDAQLTRSLFADQAQSELLAWRTTTPASASTTIEEEAEDQGSASSADDAAADSATTAADWSAKQMERLAQRLEEKKAQKKAPGAAAVAAPTTTAGGGEAAAARQPKTSKAAASTTTASGKPAQWLVPIANPKFLDRETEQQTRLAIRSLLMYYHACLRYSRPASTGVPAVAATAAATAAAASAASVGQHSAQRFSQTTSSPDQLLQPVADDTAVASSLLEPLPDQ